MNFRIVGAAALVACGMIGGAHAATLRTLHTFCFECIDGDFPFAAPLLSASGNLYGTTHNGGTQGVGVVYEIVPNADKSQWTYRTIHDFCSAGCANGYRPGAGLIEDIHGNLYGTATQGGDPETDGGVAFMLSRKGAGWKLKTLYTFCSQADCTDGAQPSSTLTYQGAGTGARYDGTSPLYGITQRGSSGLGVVFSLAPKGGKWVEKVLARVPEFTSNPLAQPFVDASGNFYGMAFNVDTGPSLFELSHKHGGWKQTVLHAFASEGDNLRSPQQGFMMDAQGALIGAAGSGGKHDGGAIYRLVPDGKDSQLTTLHDFCRRAGCTDGSGPFGGVRQDDKGALVGFTASGGAHGGGTVFRLKDGKLKVLYSFCTLANCADSTGPFDAPAIDAAGNIYGVTFSDFGQGSVFMLTP